MGNYNDGEYIFKDFVNMVNNATSGEKVQMASNATSYIFSAYRNQGYSADRAREQVYKIWAMITSNDGMLTTSEFELFNDVFGGDYTYGEFKSLMMNFQKQTYRDEMESEFRRNRDETWCQAFLTIMCIACMADGDIAGRERTIIVGFAQVLADKFY